MRRPFVVQQDRWALPFVIAEIRAVLRIAGERGQFGRKRPGDLGRIGEPQIIIGLKPYQAVADEHAAPDLLAEVRARPMRSRSQKEYQLGSASWRERG